MAKKKTQAKPKKAIKKRTVNVDQDQQNTPDSTALIDLQRQVGNQAVQNLVTSQDNRSGVEGSFHSPIAHVFREGLLNPEQAASAVGYHNRRYDSRSTRIIQGIAGATVDGAFSPNAAESVAGFQDSNPPLVVDGKVGPNTLNVMIPGRVAGDLHEHAIQMVADFNNLDVTTNTLSVHFDAGLATAFDTTFESGNLRVIKIGPSAFSSANELRDAIQGGLDVPAPPALVIGDRPEFLSFAEEQAATAANRATFTDRRSVVGVQGAIGTRPDGIFGADTAERIAEYQDLNGLTPTGRVEEATLRAMVDDLELLDEQTTAVRMIMDFYNLSEHGALLDIAFDSSVTSNATTSGVIPGPSIVRIGPAGFSQGFEGLVHTIAHELEHVRQRKEGILSSNVREFLGESIEIMSVDMPEEGITGLMDDAGRALNKFEAMTDDEKREHWDRFEEVRDKVRERFDAASEAEKTTHQATMDGYDAVTEPPAAP